MIRYLWGARLALALSWSFWPRRMLSMPDTIISIIPSPLLNNEATKCSSFLVRVLNNSLFLLHRCSELRVQMILIIGIFKHWTLCKQTQLSNDYLCAYLLVSLLIWVLKNLFVCYCHLLLSFLTFWKWLSSESRWDFAVSGNMKWLILTER